MEATIFPIQYNRIMKTGEGATDISEVLKQVSFCRKLVCEEELDYDTYSQMYEKVQEVLRMIMKTDKLVGYLLIFDENRVLTYLFELNYHFDGTPVEFLSANKEEKIIYAQNMGDFAVSTYPLLKAENGLEEVR